MEPKLKKIILLSIVAVACMFLRSDQVNAYTGKVTDENKITWNYTLENDEIIEIKYESGEIQENLYIPSYLNGYPLTKIQDYAFDGNKNLKNVTIPKTVKEIGYGAFMSCSNIVSIEFDKDSALTKIGNQAFDGCESLTSIKIPNKVTSIGCYAFYDCSNLDNITIPDTVTEIGKYAFDSTIWYDKKPYGELYINNVLYSYKGEMPENTNIVIKEGTISIVAECFYNKKNLVNIEIPDTVVYIGDRAFYTCTGLTSIELPNSVTYMGEVVFSWCNNLTSVKLSDNLKEIKDYSFSRCDKLQDINIPNAVTNIGEGAFSNCSSLKKVSISNPIEIKDNTFYQCSNLEEVQLLGGALGIGDNAFYSCIKLSDITILDVSEEYDGKYSIGANSFSKCQSLTEITIPKNFTRIGSGAFSSCSNLEKVNILGTMEFIGAGAFYETKISSGFVERHIKDKDIVSFVIEEGVGQIGDYTFLGAENLKSVHIPSTVYHITEKAFYGCNNLETVTISQDNPYFTIEDGIIYNKNKTILIRCLPGKNTKVEIPNTVTEIEEYAFMGCSKLKGTLTVPGSIKKISEHAFERCTSEIPLVLEEGIESIEARAFSNSHFIGNLTIPNSVTRINWEAFINCDKFNGKLNLGKVEYIATGAFTNCSGFTGDLVIPEELSSIGQNAFQNCTGFDGKLYVGQKGISISYYAFLNCIKIKEIVGKISYLGEGAFANCISLINTGDYEGSGYASCAYYGCKNLKYINVKEMRGMYSGFDRATSLEEVKIKEGVTSLCSGIFARCTRLKTVYIPSTVTNINENAFYGSDNIENIYVAQEKAKVNFDEILRKYCKNIHYLDDNVYKIEKNVPQNIKIIDVQNSSKDGIKYGDTYKFKIQAVEGYEISDIIVKVKKSGEEIELTGKEVDGEVIYEIEKIKEDIEIIVTANIEKIEDTDTAIKDTNELNVNIEGSDKENNNDKSVKKLDINE